VHICELQVHQTDIHDHAPSHDVYEYFRMLFKEKTLEDFMARMDVLQEIMQVPVMMSMLVVAMDDSVQGEPPMVPRSKVDLYRTILQKQIAAASAPNSMASTQTAVSILTSSRGVHVLLEREAMPGKRGTPADHHHRQSVQSIDPACAEALVWVGTYAHLDKSRLFGNDDVATALRHSPQLEGVWQQLVQGDVHHMPCFKVLDVDSARAAYQSRHLSLQEYLCALMFHKFLKVRVVGSGSVGFCLELHDTPVVSPSPPRAGGQSAAA